MDCAQGSTSGQPLASLQHPCVHAKSHTQTCKCACTRGHTHTPFFKKQLTLAGDKIQPNLVPLVSSSAHCREQHVPLDAPKTKLIHTMNFDLSLHRSTNISRLLQRSSFRLLPSTQVTRALQQQVRQQVACEQSSERCPAPMSSSLSALEDDKSCFV